MARNVFLSFIGSSEYITCNYYFNGNEGDRCENKRFIQEAIIEHERSSWGENAEFYFFATATAKEHNWNNGNFHQDDEYADIKKGDPKKGLKAILSDDLGIDNPNIISINEGSTENDIWEIFHEIEACVQPEDCIYLDITQAFRSLPMLGIIVINYLKATKNISIGEIYYGAFEKLGTVDAVLGKELEDRNAPVLRLRSFNDIMNFSFAAKLFKEYGNADLLCQCIDETWAAPKTDFEKKLRSNLSKKIKEISFDLQTCRGEKICNAEAFKQLAQTFTALEEIELKTENIDYKALGPILQIIKEKFNEYSSQKDIKNGINAAKWCFDHKMYQQSATMLQESIVSFCVSKILPNETILEGMANGEFKTYNALDCRDLISDYLNYDPKLEQPKERESVKNYLKNNHPSLEEGEIETLVNDFFEIKSRWKEGLKTLTNKNPSLNADAIENNLKNFIEFRPTFSSLAKIRNNLNHAGFVARYELSRPDDKSGDQTKTTADRIRSQLEKFLAEFDNILKNNNL